MNSEVIIHFKTAVDREIMKELKSEVEKRVQKGVFNFLDLRENITKI